MQNCQKLSLIITKYSLLSRALCKSEIGSFICGYVIYENGIFDVHLLKIKTERMQKKKKTQIKSTFSYSDAKNLCPI